MSSSGETRIKWNEFMVHLKTNKTTLEFEVYPIEEWECTDGISYISKENEPDTIEEFEEGKCLKKLEGSFCWRGAWDGRLYFTDDEYWDSDLEELSELYNKHIMPWCKNFIMKRDPHKYYEA